MKKKFLNFGMAAIFAAALVAGVTSCNDKQDEVSPEGGSLKAASAYDAVITLPSVISSDYNCTSNNLYLLEGKTFVKSGATIRFEAGTRVEGVYSSDPVNASALVISRGAKILADGGPAAPIVFSAHIDNNNPTLESGDWGGLIILGKAPNCRSENQVIEGIYPPGIDPDLDNKFGGNNPADNSGVLKYVRVEYAGASIAKDNEINSFTFGSVGSGTVVEHCQAYYGFDDGFEFFGGTVNCKYLISVAARDDAFDFDQGYQGNLQFLVAVLDPAAPYTDTANGIECDHEKSNASATPKTRPVISNLTIVGTSTGETSLYDAAVTGENILLYGTHFRENTRFVLRNSVVYGYKTAININDAKGDISGTISNDVADTDDVTKCVFANNVVGKIDATGALWTDDAATWTPGATNSLTSIAGTGVRYPFTNRFYFNSRKALASYRTPAATGANFTGLDNSFFAPTDYKGALSTGNYWLNESWVNKNFPLY